MRSFELKIPAPVLALAAMLLMYLTHLYLPLLTLSTQMRFIISVVSLMIGLSLALLGIAKFSLAQTTVKPNSEKTTALVTAGIFRYTRNPMYLGLVICLVGFSVFLSSAFALIWVAVFVWVLIKIQIIPEERALMEKFPKEFTNYKKQVRRWI